MYFNEAIRNCSGCYRAFHQEDKKSLERVRVVVNSKVGASKSLRQLILEDFGTKAEEARSACSSCDYSEPRIVRVLKEDKNYSQVNSY